MNWRIDKVVWRNGKVSIVTLGNVRADIHPRAMLRAFEKFRLTTNDEQRSIRAVPIGDSRKARATRRALLAEQTADALRASLTARAPKPAV